MYVFLDVDGVLNNTTDWKKRMYTLNPKCVESFNELLHRIDHPKIVLISTWRNGIAWNGARAPYVDDLSYAISQSGVKIIDKTANAPDGSRIKEIKHYLRWHESDRYMILDDDKELYEDRECTENLYLTNASTGLTMKDVRAIKREFGLQNGMNSDDYRTGIGQVKGRRHYIKW